MQNLQTKETKMRNKVAKTTSRGLQEGAVREIVDGMLRAGFRDQARDLEKHLADIDKRIRALEERESRR